MGGAFLVPRGAGYVAYFYVFEWPSLQQPWHVNVLETIAGLTLLVTGTRSRRRLSLPSSATTTSRTRALAKKKNATPNLQIAQVLRRRASFAKDEQITTRQFKVTTEDNVLGGPLSRGPNYMSLFKRNAREQDSTSFVRMEIPPMIVSLLDELAEQHPEVVRVEEQQRALRLQKPVRQGRSPSPSATAQAHASKRPHSLQDLGISRTRWRYVANFAGLGTMLEIAGELGGSPACGAAITDLRGFSGRGERAEFALWVSSPSER